MGESNQMPGLNKEQAQYLIFDPNIVLFNHKFIHSLSHPKIPFHIHNRSHKPILPPPLQNPIQHPYKPLHLLRRIIMHQTNPHNPILSSQSQHILHKSITIKSAVSAPEITPRFDFFDDGFGGLVAHCEADDWDSLCSVGAGVAPDRDVLLAS